MASNIGELAALTVAISWTITAISFEYAAKRVGSLNVNLLRLPLALIYLSIFTFFTRGNALPTDANSHQWVLLLLSGVVGFVLGDLFLFKAFVHIGSRFAMLIMTLVPPITALLGWLFLDENVTWMYVIGMTLTLFGIFLAINTHKETDVKQERHKLMGVLYAVGGALGQSGGLILSKIGMQNYNAFAATQIRIIAGIVGFLIIMVIFRRLKQGYSTLFNKEGMKGILIGSFFGPFIGVSMSLYAIQHTNTGVASTIMSIVPVLIIAPSVYVFKQKVTKTEVIGAIVSFIGVTLFFL